MTGNMPGNSAVLRTRCSTGDAQNAMRDRPIDQRQQVMSQPPFAWYEWVL